MRYSSNNNNNVASKFFALSISESLLHTITSKLLSQKNDPELRKNNVAKVDSKMIIEYNSYLKDLQANGYILLVDMDKIKLLEKGISKTIELKEKRGMDIPQKLSDLLLLSSSNTNSSSGNTS